VQAWTPRPGFQSSALRVTRTIRRRGSTHWEYLCELIGTGFNLFIGLSAAVFHFAPNLWPQAHLPSQSMRLLVTGLIFAGSGSLFAISPFGNLSGAHISPAVSLAFLVRGKMHLHDFIWYVISQFIDL
jgi:aquaporin Z